MTEEQRSELADIRAALEEHMSEVLPRRFEHSLRVAETAREIACAYGVDAFEAEAAGLIHDWCKVLPASELIARAVRHRLPIAGSPTLAVGTLHGLVASVELPERFPGLPAPVFQAVARHTVAAEDMTDLDMVVFVADAIEPGRRGDHVGPLRALVGEAGLSEVFFQCFAQGLIYVMETGRYLYPTALTIYNRYALARKSAGA
ncbi:MAG: HD domain-containing protein [Coriobacteriaceae bacterium]|nr:HD domain-containing protein [Coriobacteriaceae bacterium]